MNLFKKADELSKVDGVIARRRRVVPKKGAITRRDGCVVKDTVKRKEEKVPAVKEIPVKVDPATVGGECHDDWLNSKERRKVLGKRIHEEREQLIQVLTRGYDVLVADCEMLSFNDLLALFDAEKVKQAKALELKKKEIKDKEERLGRFYESFVIVSDVESVINSEHYKLAPSAREEEVVPVNMKISREERLKRAAEWKVRAEAIRMKMAEEKMYALADKCYSWSEIMQVINGDVAKAKELDDLVREKEAAEEKARIASRGKERLVNEYDGGDKNGFLEETLK